MRWFVIASVVLGVHIAIFLSGILVGLGNIAVMMFCSASLWGWPFWLVAVYRLASGKAEKRPVLVTEREYEMLKRNRSHA